MSNAGNEGGKLIQMPLRNKVEPPVGEIGETVHKEPVLGESIENDITDTETLDQRKTRTLIILSQNRDMISDAVKLVGEKHKAFCIIADEEIFEEFFARFVADSSSPIMEQAVDQFFSDPKHLEKAADLALQIGNSMGFDKEFRIYKLTNAFPWKLDECKEKMEMLVKFGLAVQGKSDTSGVPSQYYTIIQDKEKRKKDIFDTVDAILTFAYEKTGSVKNLLGEDEKKEFEENLKRRIAMKFGFNLEMFTGLIGEIEKTQKENGDCTFLQAMIILEKKDEDERKSKRKEILKDEYNHDIQHDETEENK